MCKKPGDCRAVHAPPRSVLAVIQVAADSLSAVERVGVWQMWDVCAAGLPFVNSTGGAGFRKPPSSAKGSREPTKILQAASQVSVCSIGPHLWSSGHLGLPSAMIVCVEGNRRDKALADQAIARSANLILESKANRY
jgi:hypothetical protein